MGYDYTMQNKTPEQQAIVRQRKAEEARKEEERKKQKEIICKPVQSAADYRAVTFEKGLRTLLELRISGTALAVNNSENLNEEKVHAWLERLGRKYVKENQSYEIVRIDSVDLADGKLVTRWEKLLRVDSEKP